MDNMAQELARVTKEKAILAATNEALIKKMVEYENATADDVPTKE